MSCAVAGIEQMPGILRFKLDESLPVEAAEYLQKAGYDAITVLDEHLSGSPDQVIATMYQDEKRALLTRDIDFADILTYPPAQYAGIVVLRLRA